MKKKITAIVVVTVIILLALLNITVFASEVNSTDINNDSTVNLVQIIEN